MYSCAKQHLDSCDPAAMVVKVLRWAVPGKYGGTAQNHKQQRQKQQKQKP